MNKDLQNLINYRLKEAEDSVKEARVLLDTGMSLRAVMNRLYYAMFYAVLALLQEKQAAGISKHYGVISMFDREFINPKNAVEIAMRRRRSLTGKARKRFWQKEYWNISMSKYLSATPPVRLTSSRNRFSAAFFG